MTMDGTTVLYECISAPEDAEKTRQPRVATKIMTTAMTNTMTSAEV
jgi:hypothetical protein